MTPETAPDSPTGATPSRVGDPAQPRLADRLSALVGQAASRQEDSVSAERLIAAIAARVDAATAELRERIAVVEAGQAARMTELESLVGHRLKAIEVALESSLAAQADDPGLKAHVDEVGGALVLRLDEVLAGLAEQVEESRGQLVTHAETTRDVLTDQVAAITTGAAETQAALTAQLDDARHQLAIQLEEARGQLAGQVTESQAHLSGQVDVSRVALEQFEQTLLGHIGDLAAGVVELGDGTVLTREDLDASVAGIPGLFDGVAQAAQLDGVTATTTALRDELDGVVESLGSMRAEFNGLQAAIEKRVDDAALALAETLVAVITSMPAANSAPAISYDFDDFAMPAEDSATDPVEEAGTDGDWAAADAAADLVALEEDDEAALLEESHEQAVGVDEGAADVDQQADAQAHGFAEFGVGELETAFGQADDDDAPLRRRGLFRR